MPRALQAAGLNGVRMLLQVHDELVFEAEEHQVETAKKIIASVMEKAAEPAVLLRVPVHVDVRSADNWEAAH
jgi:DNA polymerase-1